jgi:hypothetical protein
MTEITRMDEELVKFKKKELEMKALKAELIIKLKEGDFLEIVIEDDNYTPSSFTYYLIHKDYVEVFLHSLWDTAVKVPEEAYLEI